MFRIGRTPDPWYVPFKASASGTCSSENRFDDSNGRYAVLYASSTPLGCFLETLARFRTTPASVIAELAKIENADGDQPTFGTVPASWLFNRRMGRARFAKKPCADIYRSEWLSYLRRLLPPALSATIEFDLSDLMSKNRRVSQKASTLVHAAEGFGGIYYQSRHGSDLHNWALFEPFEFGDGAGSELRSDDADFRNALKLLDLQFDPLS